MIRRRSIPNLRKPKPQNASTSSSARRGADRRRCARRLGGERNHLGRGRGAASPSLCWELAEARALRAARSAHGTGKKKALRGWEAGEGKGPPKGLDTLDSHYASTSWRSRGRTATFRMRPSRCLVPEAA